MGKKHFGLKTRNDVRKELEALLDELTPPSYWNGMKHCAYNGNSYPTSRTYILGRLASYYWSQNQHLCRQLDNEKGKTDEIFRRVLELANDAARKSRQVKKELDSPKKTFNENAKKRSYTRILMSGRDVPLAFLTRTFHHHTGIQLPDSHSAQIPRDWYLSVLLYHVPNLVEMYGI